MTHPLIWSFVLAGVGIVGLIIAGRRNAWGWAIGLGAQVLWVAYALATTQYGFLASALAYGAVYAKNFITWRRQANAEHRDLQPTQSKEPE